MVTPTRFLCVTASFNASTYSLSGFWTLTLVTALVLIHTHTHTHTVSLFCSAITMLHKCGKVRSSVHFPDCRRTSSDTSPGYTTGGVLVAPDALPCPYHPVGVRQQCASADVTSANNRKRDIIIPHSLTLMQSEPKKPIQAHYGL